MHPVSRNAEFEFSIMSIFWRNFWGFILRLVVDKVFPVLKGKTVYSLNNKKGNERGKEQRECKREHGRV